MHYTGQTAGGALKVTEWNLIDSLCFVLWVIIVCPNHSCCLSLPRFYPLIASQERCQSVRQTHFIFTPSLCRVSASVSSLNPKKTPVTLTSQHSSDEYLLIACSSCTYFEASCSSDPHLDSHFVCNLDLEDDVWFKGITFEHTWSCIRNPKISAGKEKVDQPINRLWLEDSLYFQES